MIYNVYNNSRYYLTLEAILFMYTYTLMMYLLFMYYWHILANALFASDNT